MTLLTIAREHARRQGLPLPGNVVANPYGYRQQIVGLLNEFNDDLNKRKFWNQNVRECKFTAVAQESQGLLSTLAPFDFEGIVPDTFFDKNFQRCERVLTPSAWQERKIRNFAGPYTAYRLRGGELLMNPVPAAGSTFVFEYYSAAFPYFPGTVGAGGTPATYRRYWENDLDTSTIGEDLAVAYLRWAWKREKGLDYAEEFRSYEESLATKLSRNAGNQTISMDPSEGNSVKPGIFVPLYSWKLP